MQILMTDLGNESVEGGADGIVETIWHMLKDGNPMVYHEIQFLDAYEHMMEDVLAYEQKHKNPRAQIWDIEDELQVAFQDEMIELD